MTDRLVVSYTGRGGSRVNLGLLVLFLIFVALLGAYLDDDLRVWLSRNHTHSPATLAGVLVLGSLAAACLIDLALRAVTMRPGQPALVMDRDGFQGRIGYRMRSFRWDELDRIYDNKGNVGLKPRTHGLARLIEQIPTRFGPVNAMNAVYFSLRTVDKGRAEILAFARLHAR